MGSEAWLQCLKERDRNRDACCLMDGFLLSITARTSSDRFCRVVCNHRWAARENRRRGDSSRTGAGGTDRQEDGVHGLLESLHHLRLLLLELLQDGGSHLQTFSRV